MPQDTPTDRAAGGQSHLAPVIERAPLPMVEVQGAGHIVRSANAAFCLLVGKSREELVGKPFAGIVCDDPKCLELLSRVYETGEAETHVAPADTTPAFWLYAMWPALNARDEPERVVIQLTKSTQYREDMVALNEALLLGSLQQHQLRAATEVSNAALQLEITERRLIEKRLKDAQAELTASAAGLERTVEERTAQLRASMGELEAFAYSLAHDLRAPVRAIHSFTQFALELPEGEISPAAAQLLHRVVKAATRMDSLIQDVLALTQVIQRPITLTPVNVDSLVRSLIEERPELARPAAEIAIEGPLLPVRAHEATLSQCLTNLLSNAVKFVTPGETPRVRLWSEPLTNSAPPRIRLWIEDQGIGVPPEQRGRIFELFQRLHTTAAYEGSGIGLAIVRKAVERMGGETGVEPGVVRGSRFWLELPAASTAASSETA